MRGCQAFCAILCVCVHLTRARDIGVYIINPWVHDLRAIATEPVFEELIQDTFGFTGAKLIPIKESRARKNLALPLEPDAEMLPAHYERVKPPGVDHMELKYAETMISGNAAMMGSRKKTDQSTKLSKKQKSEGGKVKSGHERAVSVEEGRRGEDATQKKRTEYVDDGGKKRIQDERYDTSGQRSQEGKSEDGASHEVKSNDKVDRVASGYRNVYHKDEYNKNHDFYDNDDHGGHTKHHGRYNERHVATEGSFKKGNTRSNFEQEDGSKRAKNSKPAESQKSLKVDGKVEGHGGFSENFQGFIGRKQG